MITPICVTAGEPAGIGPDLVLQLARIKAPKPLVVIANKTLLQQRQHALGIEPVEFIDYQAGMTMRAGQLAVIDLPLTNTVTPGVLDADNSHYVIASLERAAAGALAGEFAAMVTGPVSKAIINQAGIPFSGHTEWLATRCGVDEVVMMLATDKLRVTLATTHCPLKDVAKHIQFDILQRKCQIVHQALCQQFGLTNPVINVLGLNPHAGENGYLGDEELKIIEPVIKDAREQGMNVVGPSPADTAFNLETMAKTDAYLAMYHDQGLPVLKHVGFHRSVNITLGLPIVRTSVDHGVALPLAATGNALADSLFHAIEVAATLKVPS